MSQFDILADDPFDGNEPDRRADCNFWIKPLNIDAFSSLVAVVSFNLPNTYRLHSIFGGGSSSCSQVIFKIRRTVARAVANRSRGRGMGPTVFGMPTMGPECKNGT